MTCQSEDGEALVAVVRKLGYDFPGEVSWVSEDGDAVFGQHYNEDRGKCMRITPRMDSTSWILVSAFTDSV